VPATKERIAQVLVCHGNGGNIGGRVSLAELLSSVGFDVLLFDYRGYGRSTGKPDEEGTYRDARAARRALNEESGDAPTIYLGESLGGAVALQLALESPPAGLVLQSTFTSVRDMAGEHYSFLPRAAVPDAYPSKERIAHLRAPLLIVHGERDEIVPVEHGRALYEAAPEPKALMLIPNVGHNDFIPGAGRDFAQIVADWVEKLP
jgi:fermentation-respiration switch protein FrsA (DUF1100 family)